MKSEPNFVISMRALLPLLFLIVAATVLTHLIEATSVELNHTDLNYDDFSKKIDKFFDDEFKETDKGRVFYSHSMLDYGSNKEQEEKSRIRNIFSVYGLVSPKWYDGSNEKMQNDMNRLIGKDVEEMDFYKAVVSTCQILVFSKWNNEIPSGVAIEVNHALDIGIPVYELVDGKFVLQKIHFNGLSYQESSKRYENYN